MRSNLIMKHQTSRPVFTPVSSRESRDGRRAPCRTCMETLEKRQLLSFGPAAAYPVGPDPQAIASADFNGDGRLDLAVANYSGDSVSVLRGNADGTFQPAVDFGTGFGPHALAVADFNGDGRLDLASAGSGSGVSVLLGNGDGTFGTASHTYIGSLPFAVAAGDLNGDNQVDLVVTSYYMVNVEDSAGYTNVLLGNGDGTFAPALTTDAGAWPDSVAVADVNADGRQDVITVENNYGSFALVLLGNGDGTLQPAVSFPTGAAFSGHDSIAVADFNGDGKPDLASGNDGGSVSILAGNGNGTFGAAQSFFAGGGAGRSLAVADFNGDGKPDLATRYSFLLGNGDGTLRPPPQYRTGSGVAVAAADFNGDGRPDLAVVNDTANNVSVFINDANWPAPGAPSIVITDAAVTEGNTGTRAITFTVSLSAAFGQTVKVNYSTADGSAAANSDYQSTSGTLTIPAGQTTGTITLLVNGDRLGEPDETFLVNLNAPINAFIADGQGVGTIVDDEPRISIGDVTKAEGKKGQTTLFTFTVTLSTVYDQAVTMSFRTVDGTAKTSDSDYVAKTGTLTFAPGETTKRSPLK